MLLNDKHLSFEFFPPRTPESTAKLNDVATTLNAFEPEMFTVTFGAGGSTREKTLETVLQIKQATDKPVAAHISCIDSTRENVRELCQQYLDNDVKHLVCLRGDVPSGMMEIGELKHANELVEYIRETFGDAFEIAVAAYPEVHPQAKSPEHDLSFLKHKEEAGADYAFTQYFFNPDAYFYLQDQCQDVAIEMPIVPGIMPITNYKQLARFSDICGAEIPRWIRQRLEAFDDNDMEGLIEFGHDVTIRLCETLLHGGAPGLHIYTMNKAEPTSRLIRELQGSDENDTNDLLGDILSKMG